VRIEARTYYSDLHRTARNGPINGCDEFWCTHAAILPRLRPGRACAVASGGLGQPRRQRRYMGVRCKVFGDWNYPREMICYLVHMHLKRRDVLRAVVSAGVVAASVTVQPTSANSPKGDDRDKRRSQYQPNSPEVQTFYRVNSYPMK
jgi:hypothetical protein